MYSILLKTVGLYTVPLRKNTFWRQLLHATVPLKEACRDTFCWKLLGHPENNGLWHSIERRPSTKGMHLDREIFKGRLQKPTKKNQCVTDNYAITITEQITMQERKNRLCHYFSLSVSFKNLQCLFLRNFIQLLTLALNFHSMGGYIRVNTGFLQSLYFW
jgi:hypothetical protein